MSISDASDFKEVVASFHKKSDLDAAIEDIINLGVHKYDIDVLCPKTDTQFNLKDGVHVIWVCVQDLAFKTRIIEIISQHSGEDIHIQDLIDDDDDDPFDVNPADVQKTISS